MSDLNNKIIPVKAWQLTRLMDVLEKGRDNTPDTDRAEGINAGLNYAHDMLYVYLGPQIAEAKTESNIEILTNH